MDNGQIHCGIDLCPDDCEVCKFYLYYVVMCHSHFPSPSPSLVASDEPSTYASETPSVSTTITDLESHSLDPLSTPA